MATLRRLYAYLAVIVTLEIWLWDVAGLLHKALRGRLYTTPEDLALPLAGLLIAMPVFALHWRWVQKDAAAEEEERTSGVRALALYVLLALTWGVVFHAGMALLARGLEAAFALPSERLFPQFSWEWAVAMGIPHALVGWYFFTVVRKEETPPIPENYALARLWYRLLWLSYSLLWVLLGVQKLLSVIFPAENADFAFAPHTPLETASQGAVLLAGGLLIWGLWGRRWWRWMFREAETRQSPVVVGFLVLWALSGLATALTVVGIVLNGFLLYLLGENESLYMLVRRLVTLGLPWMGLWAVAQWGLARFLSVWESSRKATVHRLVLSLLAFVGLLVLSTGVGALLSYILDSLWPGTIASNQALSAGITGLLLGGALWAFPWRALQQEAQADIRARASLTRRVYLYAILFLALLATLGFAIGSVFQVLVMLLGGDFHGVTFFYMLLMTLWSGGVLAYHAWVLRADRQAERALEQKQVKVPMLALALPQSAWLEALRSQGLQLPLTVYAPSEPPPGENAPNFAVVLLSEDELLALSPAWQAWLASFEGDRLVVPGSQPGRWFWVQAEQKASRRAKEALEALAQDKQPRLGRTSALWTALAYVGIFSLVSWVLSLLLPLFFAVFMAAMD